MGRRATIGLFVANIEDVFCNSICRGAFSAAVEEDVNLLVFPGKYLQNYHPDDPRQCYEYQYNTLFSYGYRESIDLAAVCVGSICSRADREEKDRLLKLFGDVPVLAITSHEEQYAYVKYDNKIGVRQAIEYLVKDQACRHIAMVAGISTNDDAVERLDAYRETLLEFGLEWDDELVIQGDFTQDCVDSTANLLLLRSDIDAIVCANDEMAKGVYRAADRVGRRIGIDLYVVGFDDIAECVQMDPPLATVRADASQMGYESIKAACRMLKEKKKLHITLDTHFVLRESAGYHPYDLHGRLSIFKSMILHNTDLKLICDDVTDYVFRECLWDYQAECQKKVLWTFFQKIFGRYFNGVVKRNSPGDIYLYFMKMIERGVLEYVEEVKFFRVLETVYQIFTEQNKILVERLELHNLLQQLQQCMIERMAVDYNAMERRYTDMYHRTNLITRDIVMFGDETEDSYRNALEKMNELMIQNSYLYIWETPQEHAILDEWNPPEHILLKAFQKKGKLVKVPRTEQKIRTCEFANNPHFNHTERYTYLVVDIYAQSRQLGLYVCDLRYKYLHYIEFITYQLSVAVNSIYSFQRQRDLQKKLEESFEQLKANNIELGTISKSDELTGILNRRGFMHAAQELLAANVKPGQAVMVCYADMDYLKSVNDTYGHDEGDFAIRACARILTNTFGKDGIVGRIGGDEFCVIMTLKRRGQQTRFRHILENVTKCVNEEADKPYAIHLSVGIGEFIFQENMELQAMIEETDELLYQEKKKREEN